MKKFRETVKNILKEASLYDPEYDEYYPDTSKAYSRNEYTYARIKVPLETHKSLLEALNNLGYSSDEVLFQDEAAPYILLEDAFVDYHIKAEGGEEFVDYIEDIYVEQRENGDKTIKPRLIYGYDKFIDITEYFLPEDLEALRKRFNSGEVELISL